MIFRTFNRIVNLGSRNRKFSTMDLKTVVGKIEEFAPKELAGSWDNVGLLVDPMTDKPIKKILLTNDLTEPVMKEAVDSKVDFILSYHPPIFSPLKRLTSDNWKVLPTFLKIIPSLVWGYL